MGLKDTIMELIRNRNRDGLRLEILRALKRIAAATPDAVAPVRDLLEPCVDTGEPAGRACLERLLGRRFGGCNEA